MYSISSKLYLSLYGIENLNSFLFHFSILNSLLAQSNDLQVISTSGSSFTYENYSVEYTLGELAIDNIGNDLILTQGFHQGNLAIHTEDK